VRKPTQFASVSLFLILAAGLVPIAGVAIADWGVVETMLAIWIELGLGAMFHALRGAISGMQPSSLAAHKFQRALFFFSASVVAVLSSGVLMATVIAGGTNASLVGGLIAIYTAFVESPDLLLPAAIWGGLETWRLTGDIQRGIPLYEGPRGALYVFACLIASLIVAKIGDDVPHTIALLVPVLVLKIGADLWVFRDALRVRALRADELEQELGNLLMIESELMLKLGDNKLADDIMTLRDHGAALNRQVKRIWTRRKPDYALIREFYASHPDWHAGAGDPKTSARILELVDLIEGRG
jgi:hypothetical protein